MKTTLLYSLIVFSFLFGPKLKVIESTSQEWAGGTFQSGYGTDYVIQLIAKKSSDKLTINQLWLGEDFYEVKASKKPGYKNNSGFSKGDTLYIQVSEKYVPINESQYKQILHADQKKCPVSFKAAALLGYSYKGKTKYLEIDSFKKLEKLIYP